MKNIKLIIGLFVITFFVAGCSSLQFPQYSKKFNRAYEKYGEPIKVENIYITGNGYRFLTEKKFHFRSESGEDIVIIEDVRLRPMNINR